MSNSLVSAIKGQHSLVVTYLLSALALFLSRCHWRFISALVKCSCQRVASTVHQSTLQLLTVTLQPCLSCWHRVNTLCAGRSAVTCIAAVELKRSWGLPLWLTCGSAKERIILNSVQTSITGIVSAIGKSETDCKNILESFVALGSKKGRQEVVSLS